MTVAPLVISPASAVAGTSYMPLPVVYGLAAVGLMSVLSLAASGMKFAWRQYMRPAKDLSKYGKWAVVTGATGGIGRAYCDYLAEQGIRLPEHSPKDGRSERACFREVRYTCISFSLLAGLNIFLISRSEMKLEQAAREITTKHGVSVSHLAVDLAKAGVEPMDGPLWTEIKEALGDLDVGVLVNNAGTSHDPAHLHHIKPEAIDRVIAVNNSSVVKLTHLVLTGMVRRERGAIVNVSTSFTTAIPAAPFLSLYTASKGFIDTFSKALSAEYGPSGIDVQV